MSTTLREVSVIEHPARGKATLGKQRKHNKKQLRKLLKRLGDPHKVMNSPKIIGGKELLRISYELGEYPYPEKISLEEYENEKHLLQIELLKVQAWVKESGQRVLART